MKQVFIVLIGLFGLEAMAQVPGLGIEAAAQAALQAAAGKRGPGIQRWKPEWERKWDETYRIGDEWGKKPIPSDQLKKETEAFRRAALATAKIGGGTAFYLGKFNGVYVAATNYHVMETAEGCGGKAVNFPLLDVVANCQTYLGSWSDIDLALFTLKIKNEEHVAKLESVRGNFKFDADIYPGQELITIGFGMGDNPWREIVANQDSDCKVFSAKNEFRFMADPDELNPGPYKSWSFANGCDISHGDSGSAMIDRKTGDVLGIIWTGRIPKEKKVQSTKYLDKLLADASPEIWTQLSYAVPAPKMKEHFETLIQADDTSLQLKETLIDLLK